LDKQSSFSYPDSINANKKFAHVTPVDHSPSHKHTVFHYFYLKDNTDRRVNFYNLGINICSDNSWWWLQVFESLLTEEHKPELKANIPSMPLCT